MPDRTNADRMESLQRILDRTPVRQDIDNPNRRIDANWPKGIFLMQKVKNL